MLQFTLFPIECICIEMLFVLKCICIEMHLSGLITFRMLFVYFVIDMLLVVVSWHLLYYLSPSLHLPSLSRSRVALIVTSCLMMLVLKNIPRSRALE